MIRRLGCDVSKTSSETVASDMYALAVFLVVSGTLPCGDLYQQIEGASSENAPAISEGEVGLLSRFLCTLIVESLVPDSIS